MRKRHLVPLDKQILVVLLRFGSLDTDTHPLLSAIESKCGE